MIEYLLLLSSSFLAATFLPLSSEGLLVYYLGKGFNPSLLLFVASIGNTLGSLLNYTIGLKGFEYLVEKEYLKEKSLKKYQKFFHKFGIFALLFSWVPIIGDPITFVAGALRYEIKKFIIVVFFAKFGRYLLVWQGYNIAT
ncbi:MAG TPA: DedA family protein [Campylobacterales bacterium]|nr:DedA family protein [Campylobacterales bacterium]